MIMKTWPNLGTPSLVSGELSGDGRGALDAPPARTVTAATRHDAAAAIRAPREPNLRELPMDLMENLLARGGATKRTGGSLIRQAYHSFFA